MKIPQGIEGLATLPPGMALSVGNFDGLHRGHAAILELCRSLRTAGATGVAFATFEPHPLTVLRPEFAPPRLMSVSQKHEAFAAAGVDYLVELPPTPEVLNASAESFWEMLRDRTRPSHIVEGSNFHFGKGRAGTIERLREWCSQSAVKLHEIDAVTVPLVDLQVAPVSSSLIRFLLSVGRVRDAAICLGRPYALRAPVVKGFERGRTIGVPTANLQVTEQLIPGEGVYAGRCTVDGKTYPVALSIGTMPTFGENPPQVEAHLIGFSGDLYGQTINVEVIDWLRDQRKFAAVDKLKAQLARDINDAADLTRVRTIQPIAALQV